ncbi:type III secretion protein [Pseudomonas cucumis]|uniref:Type III secretion protein n=1 Tax=Pseudomonas cucumis TaxID=2954082 RepID=A0ABY9ENZ0_9PSED|nr:type III secretion protein [Pseudomonas cucumis]WLG82432.1 type III secretion protein [Pseudomonas cucumis]WLG88001.1 type III secretion protein [Pseudomonas cucumis]
MSHSDADQDDCPAGNFAMIGQTVDMLEPIRRQRLRLAEQAWRRQRQVLDEMRVRLDSLSSETLRLRTIHSQRRLELLEQYRDKPMPLTELKDSLAEEQLSLRRIERSEQARIALQKEHDQQSLWAEESRLEVNRRLRDVEKLDYLLDLAREAS